MKMHRNAYLVDADLSARTGLHRLLATAGFNVKAYASVNKMVNKFESEISGVLILDMRSTAISGKELLDFLKAHGICIPIIAISCGEDEIINRKSARELSAVAFFRKPVDGTALIDAIEWTMNAGNNGDSSTMV